MVAGPPCSNCGWTLRWVPAQNAWGCDRCRAMFPAGPPAQAQPAPPQPVVQQAAAQSAPGWARPHLGTTPGAFGGSAASSSPAPRMNSSPPGQYAAPVHPSSPPGQASYVQQPQQPQPQAPSQAGYGGYPPNVYGQPGAQSAAAVEPPKKSKRGLLIAVVGVVAIGAGVGIAVGVSGGGKKKGAGSRDEVVQSTIAALGNGDAEALILLTAPEMESEVLECEADARPSEADKSLTRLRETSTKAAEKAKGLEVELVKTTDGKKKVREKGSSATKGCKLKLDVTMHELELVLKVKKGSVVKERTKSMSVVEIDGRWFLSKPPMVEPPGDCKKAGKTTAKNGRELYEKQGLGESGLARIEKATAQHCVDDGWADDVIICFAEAKSDDANVKCIAMMPESAQQRLVKNINQIVLEDIKSREVVVPTPTTPTTPTADPTTPPGPGVGAGSGSAAPVGEEVPQVCNDYLEEINKLTKCRRVSTGVRQGQRTRHELIVKGWQDARKKEAIRESTERLCKTGVDIVLDLRKTQCR